MNATKGGALALLSLLLLAVVSSAQTPRSQPQQRADTQRPTEKSNSVASPTPTAHVEPSPTVTTQASANYTYNYYYYSERSGDVAVWVQAFATVGLLLFAWWQLGFIRQGASATQKAANAASENAVASKDAALATKASAEAAQANAEAAKQGAEVARLGLLADRPYLLVRTGKHEGCDPETTAEIELFPTRKVPIPPCITLIIKNYGKGPALIDGIWSVLEILSENELRPVGDYTRCESQRIIEETIGADQSFKLPVTGTYVVWLSEDQRTGIKNGTLALVAYGYIVYRDVFEHSYKMGFCWIFHAEEMTIFGTTFRMPPALSRGPLTHNYSSGPARPQP